MGDMFGAVEGVAIFLIIYLFLLGFVLLLAGVSYVFQSLSLYQLAKRRGISHPGLAWVPVGSSWIMGSLSDQYMDVAENRKTKTRTILLILQIASYGLLVIVEIAAIAIGIGSALAAAGSGEAANFGFTALPGFLGLLGLYFVMYGVAITSTVFMYIALYRVYKSCMPSRALAYLLISIFASVAMPFLLFSVRNKDEGMVAQNEEVPNT